MPSTKSHDIRVQVATRFLDEQSHPTQNRFVFSYTVTIRNRGETPAKLLSRHWILADGNGKVQEIPLFGVSGFGVCASPRPHATSANYGVCSVRSTRRRRRRG